MYPSDMRGTSSSVGLGTSPVKGRAGSLTVRRSGTCAAGQISSYIFLRLHCNKILPEVMHSTVQSALGHHRSVPPLHLPLYLLPGQLTPCLVHAYEDDRPAHQLINPRVFASPTRRLCAGFCVRVRPYRG
jgi:hypothetical protein